MNRALLLAPILLLAACAGPRGFDRGAMSREARVETPVVNDAEIARVLAIRPQLAPPFKLAVYFRWTQPWTGADKDAVLARIAPLVGAGTLSQLIPIADSLVERGDLKSIRLAAARCGADAVLVVNGTSQIDRYSNAASALYWTIIGLFVVPGTSADALFLGNATLWDVRNEYLYASAEAEGGEHGIGTPFSVHDDALKAAARAKGMKALGEEIERRLKALAPPTAPVAG